MIKDLRAHWYDGKWVVDVQLALTPHQLDAVRDHLLRVQLQRRAGLIPGPMRDECDQTIAALRANKITQNVAGVGDRVLFDAYKSDKIISLPMTKEAKDASDALWRDTIWRGVRDGWNAAGGE